MKRQIFLVFLLIVSEIFLFSQSLESAKFDEFSSDLSVLAAFAPLYEGSVRETQALEYIRSRIPESSELSVYEKDFGGADRFHSFSRILQVTIQGARPDTLLVAVPLSAEFGGTADPKRDGALNLALALQIIRRSVERPLPVTVSVVFLGADTGHGEPRGTAHFLAGFFPKHPVSVLYLSLETFPSRILFQTGSRGVITPDWFIVRCSKAADTAALPFLTLGNENQVFRIGMSGTDSPLGRFLEAGYPAVALEGSYGGSEKISPERWTSGFTAFFENLLDLNAGGFPERWDRHYLFYQIRSEFVVIGERTYIVLLLATLSAGLLYALVRRQRMRRYLVTIRKNAWNLPLLYAFIFLFFLAATMILELYLEAKTFPTLWQQTPLVFFLLKVALSVFLFSSMFQVLRNLPISRNGSFYSASSILFLLIDIAITAVVDLSLTYYFLWALLFAFLFSVANNRYLKTACLIAAPFWLIKATADLFTLPEYEVCRVLLFSRIGGNLLLAFFMLPFMLMLIRLDFLVRHPIQGRRGFAVLLFSSFSGLFVAGITLYVLLFSPYNDANPQPLEMTERLDTARNIHTLSLSSPAPLGALTLRRGETIMRIESPERAYETELGMTETGITIVPEAVEFLDRKRYRLTITSKTRLVTVSCRIRADGAVVLYDANFPFAYLPELRSAELYIGRTPPLPLVIEFTLPRSSAVTAELELVAGDLPVPWSIPDRRFGTVARFVMKAEVPLWSVPSAGAGAGSTRSLPAAGTGS
jgi:hypothetical protein